METKSRYEVISGLESEKRQLILERDSFEQQVKNKEKEIKLTKREMEDSEEELEEFKESIEDRKKTIQELITSVDESLRRLSNLQSQKK